MTIPTRPVLVELYAPTATDSHGAPIDAWAPAHEVQIHGWQQPERLDQPTDGNRRPVLTVLEVLAPAAAGGPRARWTLPGAGVFEQVGHAAGYGNGPWWADAGAVIRVERVEG